MIKDEEEEKKNRNEIEPNKQLLLVVRIFSPDATLIKYLHSNKCN